MLPPDFKIRPLFVRRIVLVCVIASLCFSVGEGLRLRPFPVASESDATNTHVNASSQSTLATYGPVALPTRAQNRGKWQTVEFGNPPTQDCHELIAHQVFHRDRDEGAGVVSILFRFSSTGRAPPSFS
jgi:hypothetical protein